MSLDEVSKAIGNLQSKAEDSIKQREILSKKIDEGNKAVADLTSIIKEHVATVELRLASGSEQMQENKKDIEGLKKFRTRVYIAVAGTTGTGTIAAVLTKLGLK
jgi:predicted  nucleic acid-binding Zn-ribbon protein